jgi:hypothetical protein
VVIEAPGGPADLVARVNAWRRDASSCNGTFARRIPHLLGRLGLVVIEVAAFALMFTYPRDAFGLPGWVAYAIELGGRFGRTTSGSGRRGSPLLPTRAAFLFVFTYLVCSGPRPTQWRCSAGSGSACVDLLVRALLGRCIGLARRST